MKLLKYIKRLYQFLDNTEYVKIFKRINEMFRELSLSSMSTSKNTISGVTQSMIKMNMSLHELNGSEKRKGIIAYQKLTYLKKEKISHL